MVKEIELDWEITGGCNLRCKHCIVSANGDVSSDIEFDDVINFLEKLRDYKVSINFTGGEPFFRKDFMSILDYCIKNNIKVQVITNGLLFNDEIFDYIKLKNGETFAFYVNLPEHHSTTHSQSDRREK